MVKGAIIGCGRIVEEWHIPAFKRLREKVAITAIADASPERLSIVGKMLGISSNNCFLDYKEMLNQEDLAFVDIAVPHFLHEEIAVECARKKINLLIEKPLATNLKSARNVIKTAMDNSVKLCPMHNFLYPDMYRKAVELIDSGEIGVPYYSQFELIQPSHWRGAKESDPDWRLNGQKSGGGVLLDNGYHAVYLSEKLLKSPITKVFAKTIPSKNDKNIDMTAVLLMEHKNGGLTCIQVSWGTKVSRFKQEIHGDKGSLQITPLSERTPLKIYSENRCISPRVSCADVFGFTSLFKEFITSLEQDKAPPVGAEEAERTLITILSAYDSSKKGRFVKVDQERSENVE